MLHIKKAKLKIPIISATLIVVSLVVSFFVSPHQASAITQAECTAQGGTWVQVYGNLNAYPCSFSAQNYSAADQIRSYAYYQALSVCGNGQNYPNTDNWSALISLADALTPSKWPGTKGISVGYIVDPQDGVLGCNEMIDGALGLWGYTSSDYETLLHDFGYTLNPNYTSTSSGTNPTTTSAPMWVRGNNNTRAKFQDTIKKHIYNGQDPSLDTGLLYYQAQAHLEISSACSATPYKKISDLTPAEKSLYTNNTPVTSGNGSGVGGSIIANNYLIVRLVDGTTWKTEDWVYKISADNYAKTITLNENPNGGGTNEARCVDIANAIKGYANTIAADAAVMITKGSDPATKYGTIINTAGSAGNVPQKGAGANTDPAAETCNVTGIGWIVCPVATLLGKVTDSAYGLVEKLLVFSITKPGTSALDTTNNPVYTIWSNIRNLANIVFIFAFFAIIFSQATSFGIGSYGIKKMLPRLIAAAILVNLSYFICIFAIDLSNIIGAGIDGIIKSVPLENGGGLSSDSQTVTGFATGLVAIAIGGGIAVAVGGTAMLAALLLILPTALFAILTALVVLIARQAILTLLVIIAPLAFVAFILPNTESIFGKWRKLFMAMLVFYPLTAILFAGSDVAASILRLTANGGEIKDQVIKIMSLGVQVFPLFGLPFLLKFSGGALSKIASVVNNPNKGPFDSMRKSMQTRGDRMKAKSNTNALKKPMTDYTGKKFGRTRRTASSMFTAGGRARRNVDNEHSLAEAKSAETKAGGEYYTGRVVSDDAYANKMAGGTRFKEADAAEFQRVRTGGRAQEKRAFNERVGLYQTSYSLDPEGANTSSGGYLERQLQEGVATNNKEQVAAVINRMSNLGVGGRNALRRVLTSTLVNDKDMQQTINNSIYEDNFSGLVGKAGDIPKGKFDSITHMWSTAGAISELGSEQLATQDVAVLTKHKNIISQQEAYRIVNEPELRAKVQNIDALAIFEDIIKGYTPPTTPPSRGPSGTPPSSPSRSGTGYLGPTPSGSGGILNIPRSPSGPTTPATGTVIPTTPSPTGMPASRPTQTTSNTPVGSVIPRSTTLPTPPVTPIPQAPASTPETTPAPMQPILNPEQAEQARRGTAEANRLSFIAKLEADRRKKEDENNGNS